MMAVIEQYARDLDEAVNRRKSEQRKLEELQRHMGEFMLLNKDVAGLDLSSYYDQENEIRSEIESWRSQVEEIKNKLLRAIEAVTA